MKKSCVKLACAFALALTAFGAARADIRVKKTTTFGGAQAEAAEEGGRAGAQQEFITEEMIKGQRQRTERSIPLGRNAPSMKQINILQCDLRRYIAVGEATRKYVITPLDGVDETQMTPDASATGAAGAGRTTRGGVITYTRAVTDTGERKQMFGFTARHLRVRTTMQPSPDACDKIGFVMETDGWYVDLDVSFECLTNQPPPRRGMGAQSGCQDRIVYRNTGAGNLGYALEETTRMFAADGKTVQTETTTKVTELSRQTLDPALFDIPAGYTQASSQQELFDQRAMMQAMMQSQGAGGGEDEGGASNRPGTGGMSAAGPGGMGAASPGAKQPGAIRVGVVRVGNKTTQSIDAGTLRATLIASITEAGVEAVPLNESAPDAAQAEAKQKECDYVLFTDVSGLKQSTANKIGGMFGRATGVGSSADRFEAKLDYTLSPVAGGQPTQANVSAKEDGGADVSVNSALRKEAQAVAARVRK